MSLSRKRSLYEKWLVAKPMYRSAKTRWTSDIFINDNLNCKYNYLFQLTTLWIKNDVTYSCP